MAQSLPPEIQRFKDYLLSVRSGETAVVYADRAVPLLYKFLADKGLSLESGHRLLLQDFVSWMVNVRNLHPVTVRPMVAGALKFIEFAKDEGRVIPDIKRPDMPRLPKGQPPVLLRNDAVVAAYLRGLVIAEIPEPTLTLLRLMPFCGLRVSEMVKLRVDDVLVAERPSGFPQWILIKVRHGKGDKFRKAALLPPGVAALRYYAPELLDPGTNRRGWRSHRDGPWLWPSAGGVKATHHHHIHRITVESAVVKVRPHVGMPLTPRALRRTYGSMLAAAGVPMKVAQDYMGHASIMTTAKYYMFLDEEQRLKLMDKAYLQIDKEVRGSDDQ